MTRVLVAPDKFKGSLTAVEVAEAIGRGLTSVRPDLDVVLLPVADGGDGTLDSAVRAGYERVAVQASGPTGEPVATSYARLGSTGVVEMADVCGLSRLPGGRLEPMAAGSRGFGEVMAAALAAGCTRIVLGIGGSASTDGGAGLLQALGARALDAEGREVSSGGAEVARVVSLERGHLQELLDGVEVVVASDVDNPLVGPAGAAAVYGPQKGADAEQIVALDAGLRQWADLVASVTGRDVRASPGAGAAGGVGFAALALLGARVVPGIELVLDLIGFRALLDGADLVITGEGALDEQTLSGKAPAGVAAAADARGVPVVAVCGRSGLTDAQLRDAGFRAVYSLESLEPDQQRSMADASSLLERAAAALAGRHLLLDAAGSGPEHGGGHRWTTSTTS